MAARRRLGKCVNRRQAEESKTASRRNKTAFHSSLANQKINIAGETVGTSRNGRGSEEFSGRGGRFQKSQQNKNSL